MQIEKAFIILPSIFLISGCVPFDEGKIRHEQTQEFQSDYIRLTENVLKEKAPLDLWDCIELALQNNLHVRQAELEAGIAKLERRIAFANFLPVIELSGRSLSLDHQPMLRAGEITSGNPLFIATQDKSVREGAIEIQWSVFRPSTWFLYAARRRGEEIGVLIQEIARQGIRMEVTAQYFQCLSLREAVQALESQVLAAGKLFEEIRAMKDQGLATELQVEETHLYLMSLETEQARLKRAEKRQNASLMFLMGLMPTRPCALVETPSLTDPEGTIQDQIVTALINHPQLHISDRTVAINREMVKTAIADFLPSLVGFGGVLYTSDSYMKYATTWSAGLSGVMTVFNGFANVNQYRIAKEREKKSWLQREEACLAVMLQVLQAHLTLEDVHKGAELAEKHLDIAETRLAQAHMKWREGLAMPTEILRMVALRDEASRNRRVAQYRTQVGIATLLHAMGTYGDEQDKTTIATEYGFNDSGKIKKKAVTPIVMSAGHRRSCGIWIVYTEGGIHAGCPAG